MPGLRRGPEDTGLIATRHTRTRRCWSCPPEADERVPGAAVTVALCGRWEHEPPCPLAPHHVRADRSGGELRVTILFAAEPDAEPEVRRLELALSGQWPLPGSLTAAWRLTGSRASDVTAAEEAHAGRLIGSNLMALIVEDRDR